MTISRLQSFFTKYRYVVVLAIVVLAFCPLLIHAQTPPAPAPTPAACQGSWGLGNWSPLCWITTIGITISWAMVYLGVSILTTAGFLLNEVLRITVAEFGTTYESIKPGVEAGWSVFRDIGNILIIGVFTFIAISMIIGNQTYGAKKLVANVIVVAVLINFSLLFTKIVIDVSHFVAKEFYTAAIGTTPGSLPGAATVTPGGTVSPVSQTGLAGKFMGFIGIQTIADTWNQIVTATDRTSYGLGGIGFGLLAFLLLVLPAVILAYAAFLLIARAVLLIILLMTSSLAFVSWLVPKYAQHSYGWSGWWSALIGNAIFAPLLLGFLWAILQIATILQQKSGSSSLGNLATDPGSNILALIYYLLILGLLFAAIRITSSFAESVPHLGLGRAIATTPFIFGGRAIGIATRPVAGRIGRVGERTSLARAELATRRLGDLKDKTGLWANTKKMYYRNQQAGNLADAKMYGAMKTGSFNPAQSQIGKAILEKLGAPKPLMGGKDGSHDESVKAVAKKAAEYGVAVSQVSKTMKEQVRAEAQQKHEDNLKKLEADKAAANIDHERALQRAREGAGDRSVHENAIRDGEKRQDQLTQQLHTAAEQIRQAKTDADRKAGKDLADKISSQLGMERRAVQASQEALGRIDARISKDGDVVRARQALDAKEKEIKAHGTASEAGEKAVKGIVKAFEEEGEAAAKRVANWSFGGLASIDSTYRNAATELYGKRKNLADKVKQRKDKAEIDEMAGIKSKKG